MCGPSVCPVRKGEKKCREKVVQVTQIFGSSNIIQHGTWPRGWHSTSSQNLPHKKVSDIQKMDSESWVNPPDHFLLFDCRPRPGGDPSEPRGVRDAAPEAVPLGDAADAEARARQGVLQGAEGGLRHGEWSKKGRR